MSWPGSADAVRERVDDALYTRWRTAVEALTDDDLRSTERTRFPFTDRPFGDVVACATIELMKSAAEIGYARFHHAARL